MKWNRIKAMCLRHLYPMKRDYDLVSDALFWPFLDVILWGLTSQWLTGGSSTHSKVVVSILIAIVIWNVLWRAQLEISRDLLDEFWNNNLVNLFSTPLSILEWSTAILLLSIVKMLAAIAIISLGILALYQINVTVIGWWLLPFMVSAMMTGWAMGFIVGGLIIRYGYVIQTVAWSLPGLLLPLSAVYFPLSQLPVVLRQVASVVPTSYIFEAMRGLVNGQPVVLENLLLSFGLNVVYLIFSAWFFAHCFKKSKELNLARF
ncbi:MAG: ABC transporter permease [bacterium]